MIRPIMRSDRGDHLAVMALASLLAGALVVACGGGGSSAGGDGGGDDGSSSSSSGGGSSGGTTVTRDQACHTYAEIQCDLYVRCWPQFDVWSSPDACIADVEKSCGNFVDEVGPASLEQCFEAHRSSPHACPASALSDCVMLARGPKGAASSCYQSQQCSPGLQCDQEGGVSGCGTCVPAAPAGARCDIANVGQCDDSRGYFCEPGASASFQCTATVPKGGACTDAPCDPRDPASLVCLGGTCQPMSTVAGGPCLGSCGYGLYCGGDGTCHATLGAGATCSLSGGDVRHECDPSQGLACLPGADAGAAANGTCQFAFAMPGEPCSGARTCWRSFCPRAPSADGGASVCAPYRNAGESCDINFEASACLPPYVCTTGTCALPPNGPFPFPCQ